MLLAMQGICMILGGSMHTLLVVCTTMLSTEVLVLQWYGMESGVLILLQPLLDGEHMLVATLVG